MYIVFNSRFSVHILHRNWEFFFLLRCYIQSQTSFFNRDAIGTQLITNSIFSQISEIETVYSPILTGSYINSIKCYILMYILHFCHSRMRLTVGPHQTITTEITIAWHIYSIVSSVCPVFTTVLISFRYSLIHPVPNISTLKIWVFIDFFPLIPQITIWITHSMRVFRWNYRAIRTCFSNISQPFCTRVLRYVHIRIPFPLCTLIIYGAVH